MKEGSVQTERPTDDDDDAVYAAVAAALKPAPLAQTERERMLARIHQKIAAAPPPAGTQTYSVAGDGWVTGLPNVLAKMLRLDTVAGTQELLMRFLPGAVIPAHSHTKEEEMVILEGECHVGDHPLRAGDVHIAPPGSSHPKITTSTGTLLLLRCEYPFPVDRAPSN